MTWNNQEIIAEGKVTFLDDVETRCHQCRLLFKISIYFGMASLFPVSLPSSFFFILYKQDAHIFLAVININ